MFDVHMQCMALLSLGTSLHIFVVMLAPVRVTEHRIVCYHTVP